MTFNLNIKTAAQARAESIAAARAEAKAAMTSWINRLTGAIQDQYPEVVQRGWDDELAMAVAFMNSTETEVQLATLTADGAARGRTAEEHAIRILEKANLFHAVAAQTRRLWLATDKALDAVDTPDGFDVVLGAAQAQAAPLARAYGLTT